MVLLMQATLTPQQPRWPLPLPRGAPLPSPTRQPLLRPSRRTAATPTRLHLQVRAESKRHIRDILHHMHAVFSMTWRLLWLQPCWPLPLPREASVPSPMQQPVLTPLHRTAAAATSRHLQVRHLALDPEHTATSVGLDIGFPGRMR